MPVPLFYLIADRRAIIDRRAVADALALLPNDGLAAAATAVLEQMLRDSLDHPWTVEEMAAVVGLGSTAFTEKVKAFSGFSPLNYLINIRIAEAMKQLRQSQKSLTDIALDTGFYSSQHFSTTFKKLTGYTPGQFRKRGQE